MNPTRNNSGPTFATRNNSGPTYATRNNSGPTYAKIIGANLHGCYPFRVGLNTLAYNGEHFDARPECGPGGLYYCELKDIGDWINYGHNLCIVRSLGTVIPVEDKFKTDRLEIIKMMPLTEPETWDFLIETESVTPLFALRTAIEKSTSILEISLQNAYFDVVKYLAKKVDVFANSFEIFRLAISGDYNWDVLKFLIKECAMDVHVSDDFMLRWATSENLSCLVRLLIDRGADVNARNGVALSNANTWGHIEIMKMLIEGGANINQDNCEVLQSAVSRGQIDFVEYLVANGAEY